MIKEILIENFRNLKDTKIRLSNSINLFYGMNAQGKTSLMEAIYLASTGKSFRTKKVIQAIKYEKLDLKIFVKLNDFSKYSIQISKDMKKYFNNGKKIPYKEYIGKILAISFIPEDVELVSGIPSLRRGFFNYEISQTNLTYLEYILEYEKVLKVRNRYLKEKNIDNDIFEIYNKKYINLCYKISKIRKEYIKNLNEILFIKYRELFNKDHKLNIIYDSFSNDLTLEEIEQILKQKLKVDLLLGYSSIGIHKDDYIFYLNDKEAKYYSSQGEKKSIVFAIKISEIEYMEKYINRKPIFLLDDLTSFFDEFRKKQIINYFLEKNIQCYITATNDLKLIGKKFYFSGGIIYEKN